MIQIPSLWHGHMVCALDHGSEFLTGVIELDGIKMDALLVVDVDPDQVDEDTSFALVPNTYDTLNQGELLSSFD